MHAWGRAWGGQAWSGRGCISEGGRAWRRSFERAALRGRVAAQHRSSGNPVGTLLQSSVERAANFLKAKHSCRGRARGPVAAP